MKDDDEHTPVERPSRAHDGNLPYIRVIGDAIPVLNSVVNTLGEVLRELRLARHPMGQVTLDKIASAGASLSRTGLLIKRGFRAG